MGTIRHRLLVAFILLVLLPAIIISVSAVSQGLHHGQRQVINQLQSVATLKDEQIESWLTSLQSHLTSVLYPYQVPHLVDPLLTSDPESPVYEQAYTELRIQFEQMIAATDLFEEVLLLDRQGRVLLSTNQANEGQVHATQTYFWSGLREPYRQSLSSATAQGLSSPVVVSRPVINPDGSVSAVLVGRASTNRLNAIMLQRAGLGETGETYLVGPNFLLLTDSRFEDRQKKVLRLWTATLENVFHHKADRSGLYINYRNQPVVGFYHWLPSLQMVLVAEQEQNEAFQLTYKTLLINIIVAIMAVLIALISALFTARSIADPLSSLAHTATRIAAGDLHLQAQIEGNDEVRALATAFNSMTARLRQVIGNLERHIGELQQAEAEVRRVNDYLARDVDEQATLNRLSNMLQRCQTLDEAYAGSISLLHHLFKDWSGALYRHISGAPALACVGQWGQSIPGGWIPPEADCPALQQGERFILTTDCDITHRCQACSYGLQPVMCAQLQTGGERFGLLHIRVGSQDIESLRDDLLPLIIRTADLLTLALYNLHLRENLREQAIRDSLTGLFNRRFLSETLEQILGYAQRHQHTVGIFLLDIDYFKRINDTYGHDAGDAVLRTVGLFLNTNLRTEDTACRFGGEEMLLVLPEIRIDDAFTRADTLRQAIHALTIEHAGMHLPPITVSIGVAIFPDHGLTPDTLISAADQSLYRAKATGRNRVCITENARENASRNVYSQ